MPVACLLSRGFGTIAKLTRVLEGLLKEEPPLTKFFGGIALIWGILVIGACQAGSLPDAPPSPVAVLPSRTALPRTPPSVSLAPTLSPSSSTPIAPTETTRSDTATPPPVRDPAAEVAVELIPVGRPLSDATSEISGMAWYGDTLILLPQYPDQYEDGRVFALAKSEILTYLDTGQPLRLEPELVAFDDGGLGDSIRGFEGFEAIAFAGNQFYVTIEASPSATTMMGYLVRGNVTNDGTLLMLTVEPSTLIELPSPTGIGNFSDEAIVIADDAILTFHEANGANVNPAPQARCFALTDLQPQTALTFPTLEYRLTDATPPDDQDRFWVINYLFPGDIPKVRPADDGFSAMYEQGATHAISSTVERLIEFQISADGITATDTAPLPLELLPGLARNWEGIARLDARGFLLVTDQFPTTLLGFVRK